MSGSDDDDDDKPAVQRNAQGVAQYHTGTPGVGGALSDFVSALARAFAGSTVPQLQNRGRQVNQAVDEASGSPQTTDLGQQF
jgi:uncharacterized protein YukE